MFKSVFIAQPFNRTCDTQICDIGCGLIREDFIFITRLEWENQGGE